MPEGQLEALPGIVGRRWWQPGFSVAEGAAAAARKAFTASRVPPSAVEVLIYAAVCREQFEPATACNVAAAPGICPETTHHLSNPRLAGLPGHVATPHPSTPST